MLGILFSSLSTVLTTVGPVVGKVATALVANLPKIAEIALNVARVVAGITQVIAQVRGLSLINENVEELGAKTMQEGTRARMEEESIDDYLNYLRNEVELDKEKMRAMSVEDKIRCNVIGTGMLSESISKDSGIDITGNFLYEISKMKMSGEEINKYIDAFSANSIDSMESFVTYLRGDLSGKDSEIVGNTIESVVKSLAPDSSRGEVLMKIEEMKESLEG